MLLALLLSSSVLPEGKPAPQIVDRIEQLLDKNRCVKPLTQWWRHYALWHEGTTDPRFIDVWFIQAGHDHLPQGRFITNLSHRRSTRASFVLYLANTRSHPVASFSSNVGSTGAHADAAGSSFTTLLCCLCPRPSARDSRSREMNRRPKLGG